jgi:CRISPR-associated protein Cas5h
LEKVILKNYPSNNKMVDKLLIFDLTGKFACWKKFYSNSSSFTYEIPSRTAIIGILASILEKPRDSYYEVFSSENCKISLSLKSDIKKKFYCMNYFMKPNKREYTQVRLEILTPKEDLRENTIRYRVFVWLKDKKLFGELVERVKEKNYGFGIYLGQRQFKGEVEYIDSINKEKIKRINDANEINSIVNLNNISDKERIGGSNYSIDTFPIDFKFCGKDEELNKNILNREIQKTGKIVYQLTPDPLIIKSNLNNVFEVEYKENKENICFYE